MRRVLSACCVLALLSPSLAQAADRSGGAYPTKPIRWVMPYPVGGSIDLSGRVIAAQLSENLGQQVVIDNRTGAGGTLGTEIGARAAPDGYTVVMGGTGTLAISPGLGRKLGYDPLKDFAPITLLATTPYVLVVHPSVPVNSTRELIALGKSQPGKLNYASGGSGSAPHLIGEIFRTRAGIDVVHVPYKGSTPAKIDLLGGRVQMFFTGIPSVLAEIRGGKLKPIGITSARRSATLPEVATIAESGVPGFDVSPWFGVLAPARTPPALVKRLHQEYAKALKAPAVRDPLTRDGVDPVGNSPEEFSAYIRSELAKWGNVVKASGATVN